MPNSRLISIIIATFCWPIVCETSFARWGMSGGDPMRLAFVRAKENAAHITLRLNPAALPANLAPAVREWIVSHKEALAADIAASPHDWELAQSDQASCALTDSTGTVAAATILFSYDKCRLGMDQASGDAHTAIPTYDAVGQLLVHESVHHLHGADESFCDQVAIALYDAWRRGGNDWMTPANVMPEPKQNHSATMVDDSVVVYGGYRTINDPQPSNTGFIFDVATHSWTGSLPTDGAPRRALPILLYTGSKLIVWGGYTGPVGGPSIWQNSGAVFDFANQSWTTIVAPVGASTMAADEARAPSVPLQSAVWTGKEMIVYGGDGAQGGNFPGGIFNPEKPVGQQWRKLSANGAPSALGWRSHTAVWADDRMIVFGGHRLANLDVTNTTGIFNPVTNRWTVGDASGAPTPRDVHTAVWTGSQMVVFGGYGSSSATASLGSGGIFDPKLNKWVYTYKSEAVQGRYGHSAVWSGGEMLVFGGHLGNVGVAATTLNSVAAFNPSTRVWRVVEVAGAPARRSGSTSVWTGAYMLIAGGQLLESPATADDGAIFFP